MVIGKKYFIFEEFDKERFYVLRNEYKKNMQSKMIEDAFFEQAISAYLMCSHLDSRPVLKMKRILKKMGIVIMDYRKEHSKYSIKDAVYAVKAFNRFFIL